MNITNGSCTFKVSMESIYLSDIVFSQFKNYEEAQFGFIEGVNCLVGTNGSGKTNVLDGIHYLSKTKGYFNPIDSQNVQHGADLFLIKGTFSTEEGEDVVSCAVKPGQKKKFTWNRKEYSRLSDHFGRYPSVMIAPNDTDLIREGSEVRRKFLDAAISQYDRGYLENLMKYSKVLAQRNNLLKYFAENRTFDEGSLEIWDEQMVNIGQEIYNTRTQFLSEFESVFLNMYQQISRGKETVQLEYKSHYQDSDFASQLRSARDKALQLRRSTHGVHKDDLLFQIESHPLKRFGSQGQQKSYLIALKLALFEYIANETQKKPILLLDDIFDKIDDHRVAALMELVSKHTFGQIFITDTHLGRVPELFENAGEKVKVFEINQAQVKPREVYAEKK